SELRGSRHRRPDHLVLERRRKGAHSPAASRLRLRSIPVIACPPSPCLRIVAGPQSRTVEACRRRLVHHSPKLGVVGRRHIPLFRYGPEIPQTSERPGCPGPSVVSAPAAPVGRRPRPSYQGELVVPPALPVSPPEVPPV